MAAPIDKCELAPAMQKTQSRLSHRVAYQMRATLLAALLASGLALALTY